MDEQMKETRESVANFANLIRREVEKFIDEEECYSDDTQLRINTATLEVELADPEDDLDGYDYYPVMDLVRGSETDPGKWIADEDAIEEVAVEYISE